MKHFTTIIMFLCVCSLQAQTNESFDEFRRNLLAGYSQYREDIRQNYNSFRDSINQEFAKALQTPWLKNRNKPLRPLPDHDIPPVVPHPLHEQIRFKEDFNHQSINITPIHQHRINQEDKEGEQEEVLPYIPVVPQEEMGLNTMGVAFMGTVSQIRIPSALSVRLQRLNEKGVSAAWSQLTDQISDNTLNDCLAVKQKAHLCDWAYFQFLEQLSRTCYPDDRNMSTLMHAYLFCQSGYKIRLGYGASRLYLLYASQHKIYGQNYFNIDNESFYPYQCNESSLKISRAKFPHEQPLSLVIKTIPQFEEHPSAPHTINGKNNFSAQVRINKDLLKFFEQYPSSSFDNNDLTRWMIYADTPLSVTAQRSFYGPIALAIQNMDTVTAVQYILTLVQHSFTYGYDEQIWGGDRAFFPEETLFYPRSDCEDHAILFTRILRDLLGLKCALVYSPGHLYTAVCLPSSVKGHTLHINNERYVICDPTYEGASIGVIMPTLENKEKSAIVLQ